MHSGNKDIQKDIELEKRCSTRYANLELTAKVSAWNSLLIRYQEQISDAIILALLDNLKITSNASEEEINDLNR